MLEAVIFKRSSQSSSGIAREMSSITWTGPRCALFKFSMTPSLRSISSFFRLKSSTWRITGASSSTFASASAISLSLVTICRCRSHHQAPKAIRQPTIEATSAHCARSLPSRTGLIFRTDVGRFPSAIKLILIIALVSQLADRQPDRDGHHRCYGLQPGRVEVLLVEADAADWIEGHGRHREPLAQHLGQIRREGAAPRQHQLVDRSLGRGRREEVESLADLARHVAGDRVEHGARIARGVAIDRLAALQAFGLVEREVQVALERFAELIAAE